MLFEPHFKEMIGNSHISHVTILVVIISRNLMRFAQVQPSFTLPVDLLAKLIPYCVSNARLPLLRSRRYGCIAVQSHGSLQLEHSLLSKDSNIVLLRCALSLHLVAL